jgi:hypothetical protein
VAGPVTEERRDAPAVERSTGLRMDPRIARRWVEVRREQGRRRLKVLAAAGAVALILALAAGSLYTPIFKVRHVRVTVSGSLAPAIVEASSRISGRTLMIHVNSAVVERRLDAVPQLGDAKVRTHWPGTVSIEVAVRKPVAVIQAGGAPASGGAASPAKWSEVDATGRVIAVVDAPPAGLPLLEGLGPPPGAGEWLSGTAGRSAHLPAPGQPALADLDAASDGPAVPEGAAAVIAVAANLPQQIRGAVQAIQIQAQTSATGSQAGAPAEDRTLSMIVAPTEGSAGPLTVALGDGSQLAAKLTALTALLTQTDLSGITGIDLTVPDRPAALTGQRSPDSLSTHAGGSH